MWCNNDHTNNVTFILSACAVKLNMAKLILVRNIFSFSLCGNLNPTSNQNRHLGETFMLKMWEFKDFNNKNFETHFLQK